MRFFFTIAIAGLAILLSPVQANASITLGDLVPNVVNELEDNDFDMLVNAGGNVNNPGADTILNVGDYIAGILSITALNVPPGTSTGNTAPPNPTLTAVVLQRVTSVSGPGIGTVPDGINDVFVTFTAPTIAEWNAVIGVVAGAAIPTTVAGNTFAVVFQDANGINQNAGSTAAFATADGLEAWEFGFLGVAGEVFQAAQDTDDLATAFTQSTGSYNFRMNVTEQGAGPALAPFDLLGGGNVVQVWGQNGSIGSPSPGANPPFIVSTDIDILGVPIAIPEPASVLAWIGLFGAFGLYVGRRRRRSTAG